MARPVIALLTDFGTKDHYAGTMKGVALGICPEATCIDITHDIAPHDILGGALELAASYRYFPPGTVFLVVVDPGVGSTRRPLAAEAGGYRFVAPDNGVLSYLFASGEIGRVVEITAASYLLHPVSQTFHGRDVFAPVAGHLSRRSGIGRFGQATARYVRLPLPVPTKRGARVLVGSILHVDRFGNLISNITARQVREFRAANGQTVEIHIGTYIINELVGSYSKGSRRTPSALINSSGNLEIFLQEESAAQSLRVGVGEEVRLC